MEVQRRRAKKRGKGDVEPSRMPHNLHPWAWWYEDKRGITVVQEARRPDGTHISTELVRIPWSRLMKAAARCGAR